MTKSFNLKLKSYFKRESEAAQQRERRKYSDSEEVLSIYEIHSGIVRLLRSASYLSQKVADSVKDIQDRTNEIEDEAYAKKRRQSGKARQYPRERPKSFVLTNEEMRQLFPAKPLSQRDKKGKSKVFLEQELNFDCFQNAMKAMVAGKYPIGVLPCNNLISNCKGDGKTTFTLYYGTDHPTDPRDDPDDVDALAEFICDFHNTFLMIHTLNRNFTRWDVFATASGRPRKLWFTRGSSRHDVWIDVLSKMFSREIWPLVADLDDSFFDYWPYSNEKHAPVEFDRIREVISRRYRVGEPTSAWGDRQKDYILTRFYSRWNFPIRADKHRDKLSATYARLESEFLRAVDIQRNRDAMKMRLAQVDQAKVVAAHTAPDGPMEGGLFWFDGKRASLSDIPWRLLKALYGARNWILGVTHLELEVWGDAQEDSTLKSAIHDVNNALTDAEMPLVVSKVRKQDVVRLYRSDQEAKTA